MITIQQTVDIPESRRVYFDVPTRIPLGKTRITVQIAEPERVNKKRPYKSICGLIEGQGVTVASFLEEKRADDAIEFAREGR